MPQLKDIGKVKSIFSCNFAGVLHNRLKNIDQIYGRLSQEAEPPCKQVHFIIEVNIYL